jgi:hypothetical protein
VPSSRKVKKEWHSIDEYETPPNTQPVETYRATQISGATANSSLPRNTMRGESSRVAVEPRALN